MMKFSVCAAFLFFTIVHSEELEGRSKEYGVKLCGREFIRTLVMSCGGSRWKRYSSEPEDFLEWLNSEKFYSTPEDLKASEETEDLNQRLHVFRRSTDYKEDPSFLTDYEYLVNLKEELGEIYEEKVKSLLLPQANGLENRSPRNRRNIGPAGTCCKWGCTKSELIRFC
uniref:Insulin-like domain-containing protein n=1 Tax=Latimeria chalumnae TaxID=7897 RepID=M3XKV1_LATCH|nr:PREDICTED: relaxin-3-like isoform X2 [Latimeria chalumnae]|eukprot:XP_014347687.1 PREDICTED: relaxin-3-like isoform X2 [Latimeria chalumnae]